MEESGVDQPIQTTITKPPVATIPTPADRQPLLKTQGEITSPILEPLSGAETAELVAQIYQLAGPRIGPLLVEANIVLTLAGARGQTEFFIANPQPNDWEKVAAVKKILESRGIKIRAQDKTFKAASDNKETLIVDVENLKGYEYASHLSRIPGISRFDASTGWEGFREWRIRVSAGLRKAIVENRIPYTENTEGEIQGMIITGISKGYPDTAIYDAIDCWIVHERTYQLADSQIPYVDIYHGAEPNFDFHPDHKNDPTIQQTITSWGKILEDFYASPWHQQIKRNPQFQQTRELRDKRDT